MQKSTAYALLQIVYALGLLGLALNRNEEPTCRATSGLGLRYWICVQVGLEVLGVVREVSIVCIFAKCENPKRYDITLALCNYLVLWSLNFAWLVVGLTQYERVSADCQDRGLLRITEFVLCVNTVTAFFCSLLMPKLAHTTCQVARQNCQDWLINRQQQVSKEQHNKYMLRLAKITFSSGVEQQIKDTEGSAYKGEPHCTICLEPFCDGEVLATMPCEAKHQFHLDCINKWTRKRLECPVCRM